MTRLSQQTVALDQGLGASHGHAAPGERVVVGVVVDRAAGLQLSPYWYTLADLQKLLRVSRATLCRHLPKVPLTERVKVTRHITCFRSTRYWRISPAGVRILGHATGQAPYL